MAAASRQKVKIGDLLEVHTSKALAYLQYIGKHPEYGDVIRVLPGQHESRAAGLSKAVAERSGYLAFYSACAAVARGIVEIVGSCPVPTEIEMPRRLRRAGARGRAGEIFSWIIEDDGQEVVRKELTEVERQLPIAAIWDHELLILRIAEGWSPEQEG